MNHELTTSLRAVQDYYGKILKSNQDLQTSACCAGESLPEYLRPLLKEIHHEVKEKFYGCGSPFPLVLRGKTVLDLGSGSGRDAFILAKLVGPEGQVIGLDMTEEQIAVANKFVDYHMQLYGYAQPNVRFVRGYIEDLATAAIASSSVDIVVSNCVINLSPAKERVFSEIFRVLKPGGELYFSDVFASRRLPREVSQDPVFWGECLGGAIYIEDFRRQLYALGCRDYRLTAHSPIQVKPGKLAQLAGASQFFSLTVRAFKLDLEDRCEDYGQVAVYQGGIPESPEVFMLDDHHSFERDKPVLVCGNTAAMLEQTRYAEFFKIIGNRERHFGLFACAPSSSLAGPQTAPGVCC